MFKRKLFGIAVGAVIGAATLSGTAFAGTETTLQVGPVAIPNVPVQLCLSQTGVPVAGTCVSTPAGQSVALNVRAQALTPTLGVEGPTIRKIPCPAGTEGVAAEVGTGSAGAAIGGTVTITVGDRAPIVIPINQTVAAAGKTVTVFACTGLS